MRFREAVAGTLTTGRDIFSGSDGDDTFDATYTTLNANDILTDGSTADNDVLSAVINTTAATAFTTVNVETINLDIRDGAAALVDLGNTAGVKTLNLLSNYSLNATSVKVDNAESGTEVNIAKSITLDAADVLTVAINEDKDASALTVAMNGDDFTLATQTAATDDVDVLTLQSNGAANKVTLNATNTFADTDSESIIATGDQDLTIAAVDTTFDVTDLALTNSLTDDAVLTLEVTDFTGVGNDLTAVDASTVISLKGTTAGTATAKVVSGARFDLDANLTADLEVMTTASDSTITVNVDATQTAGLTLAEFNTVNIGNTSAAATVLGGNVALVVAGIGEEVDVNVATGKGLTITGTTAAATGTLDAVTVTGAGAFTQTGAITAQSIALTNEAAQTFGANAVTGDLTSTIATDMTLTLGANLVGDLTVDGGGDVTVATTVAGDVALTNTGTTTLTGLVTGDVVATVAAKESLDFGGALTGDLTVDGAGDVSVVGLTTGAVTTTNTGTVSLHSVVGDADFTLTKATTGDELAITNTAGVTGNLTISGTGNANIDGSVSKAITVDGVDVDIITGETVGGIVTITGNGDFDTNTSTIAKALVAGDATGDITVHLAAAQTGTIVTGAGDDTITAAAGSNSVSVSAGAGNDIINYDAATDAVAIDGGAGNDVITGSEAADELTGGLGTDTFSFTVLADAGSSESITDFATTASGDILSVTGATTFATALTADGTTVKAIDTTDDAVTTAFVKTTDSLLLTGTGYANDAALLAALNGTSGLTAIAANDAVLAVYYNTTDSTTYAVSVNDSDGGADFDTVETLVELTGVTLADISTFTADNFNVA